MYITCKYDTWVSDAPLYPLEDQFRNQLKQRIGQEFFTKLFTNSVDPCVLQSLPLSPFISFASTKHTIF